MRQRKFGKNFENSEKFLTAVVQGSVRISVPEISEKFKKFQKKKFFRKNSKNFQKTQERRQKNFPGNPGEIRKISEIPRNSDLRNCVASTFHENVRDKIRSKEITGPSNLFAESSIPVLGEREASTRVPLVRDSSFNPEISDRCQKSLRFVG